MILYIDTTACALVLNPNTTLRILPPELTAGTKVPVTLAFLQRNALPLNTGYPVYNYLDFSGASPVLSIGPASLLPAAGTFILSFGASSTPALPWSISQYSLQATLNLLASVISAGGVAVSGPIGGPFTITFNSNGAQPLMTSPANDFFPASTLSIVTVQAGASTAPAIQVLSFAQVAASQVTSWTPQAAAAVTVSSIQGNVVQLVSIPSGTYGGTFTLTYNGFTTPALSFTAQIDVVAAALNALPGISGCAVIQGQNSWMITIPSGAYPLTGNASGLMIPLTVSGLLDLTTQPVLDLLGELPDLPIPFVIKASPGGNPQVFYSGFF
jgi:hypothetical protein